MKVGAPELWGSFLMSILWDFLKTDSQVFCAQKRILKSFLEVFKVIVIGVGFDAKKMEN